MREREKERERERRERGGGRESGVPYVGECK